MLGCHEELRLFGYLARAALKGADTVTETTAVQNINNNTNHKNFFYST